MRSFSSRLACALVVFGLALSARAIEPKYLPPNAEMAITVNLKQILASELFKDKKDLVDEVKGLLKGKLEDTPVKEYLDKAGFDVFRDLHSITITSDGSKDTDNMFIAIEGKFDTEKLIDVAKEAARDNGDVLRVTKSGNVNIFEITPKENEKTIYAGLINDSLLVAAPSRESLNATITRVNTGRGAGIKPAFKQLLETTNSKQSLSVVVSGPGLAKMAENAPRQPGGDAGAMLQNLDGLAFSITVTKDIAFQVAGTAKDDDGAKQIAMKANAGLLLGRGFVVQQAKTDDKLQPVADIANTLKISTQGSNVILRGAVSQETLDKILSFIPR